jgi:DNA-directed RNA polymerase subunit alpha
MTRIPLSRADEEARLRQERLDLSIAEIELQVRTTNCLEEKGSISNFGEKTLEEVYQALSKLGFHRPMRRPK